MHDPMPCEGCGTAQCADDPTTGDVVCTACGLVAPGDRVYADAHVSHDDDDADGTDSGGNDADDGAPDEDGDDRAAPRHADRRRARGRRKRTRRHHPYDALVRCDSLLAVAAHAVAVEYDVDPVLLMIEATRAGIPADARGSVDAALCQAIARLCGGEDDDGNSRGADHRARQIVPC